ncbi:MAG: hypothetical protein DBY38_00170 [Clostridium cadaveris]|uniref:Glycosyl transferase family 1 domain-containing protein n=1 Tax=Clostridium cadaveris TaxID=1529 RepID=A0A316MDJ9_9CLOT|nr:MAG: hypothetical protein DBY38_00170 [Clostridium cadaveris]
MTNITVLVTNIYKCGGVQRVVSMLANNLVGTGKYKITILSMFKTADNPYFDLNEDIVVNNIYNEHFSLKRGYFKAVRGLKKFFDKNKTDILIFAGMGYGSIVRLAISRRQNIKLIGWEHQSFFFGKKFGLEWLGKRIAAAHMDAVVVLTKEDYKYYKDNLKNIKKIEQIYNPINEKVKSGNYKSNSQAIISCGGLVPQKGFDYAVDVARIVFAKHPNWQWHIYGDGIERSILENKINGYHLENNLILKGYCENIYDKYKDYAIYAMTSRHEGFPMVLLEAKANKLPIVSFNCKCGPSEIVKDSINGYLIPCFDVKKMSEKIINLIENKEKRIQLSNNSIVGDENLSISEIVEKWDRLIQSL